MQNFKFITEAYKSLPPIGTPSFTINYLINPDFKNILQYTGNAFCLISDQSVFQLPLVQKMATMSNIHVSLKCGEFIKTLEMVAYLERQLEPYEGKAYVVVGSGALLNLCNYVISSLIESRSLQRDDIIVTLLPTNTMSIADVAYGSLGLINEISLNLKNHYRKILNPDLIVLDEIFIDYDSSDIQKDGIVESLKHAILQCKSVYFQCLDVLKSPTPRRDELFAISIHGLKLKADIRCSEIAGSTGIGLIRNYGHLHAGAIEEFYNFTVRHSDCVLVGLLVDLQLSRMTQNSVEIARSLDDATKNRVLDILCGIIPNKLRKFYNAANKFKIDDDCFNVIKLSEIGQYSFVRDRSVKKTQLLLSRHSWREIENCLENTQELCRNSC